MFVVGSLVLGCESPGGLAEPCRPDESCAADLECLEGVCVLAALDAGVEDADPPAQDVLDARGGPDVGSALDAWTTDAATMSTGPRLPPPADRVIRTVPGFSGAALDWERHRLFLTQGSSGTVEVVDLLSGARGPVAVGHDTAAIAFDPFQDLLVVAVRNRDRYANGWLASLDPASLAVGSLIELPTVPYDVILDGRGRAIVSGDELRGATVQLATGEVVGAPVASGLFLAMHPGSDRVYGASPFAPRAVARFANDDALTFQTYSGSDVLVRGPIRVDPLGELVFAASGNVLSSRPEIVGDLRPNGDPLSAWEDLAFDPDGRHAFSLRAGVVDVIDLSTRRRVRTETSIGYVQRVFTTPDYWVSVSLERSGAPTTAIEVRSYASP
ncbi:MAG: hypothetical protein J0L92_07525 [Deltaproteobacteria bacterium]|nr:hypothetical protein [Deltaproteobacteria bacterium]